MSASKVNKFRNGIFSLRTRRFGRVAEIMIKKLYGVSNSSVLNYDLIENQTQQRIEVKFATAIKKSKDSISEDKVIEQCLRAGELSERVISLGDVSLVKFDCNIQQIKCAEFDVLYYGIFFYDCIQIYKMTSGEVMTASGYSNKQHRGNLGEGQFHINNNTIEWHQKYMIKQLSYQELYQTLK